MKSFYRKSVAAVVLLATIAGMCGEKPRTFTDSDLNLFWKGLWALDEEGKKSKEPKIAKLTETDVLRRLTGKWVMMEVETADDLCMLKTWTQLNANHTWEISRDPEPGQKRCKGSGKWRVVSDKIAILLDEAGSLPGFMFLLGEKFYTLTGPCEMRELKREKDLAVGKMTWEPWTGQVHTESNSSPEKVDGKRGKFLNELSSEKPQTVPITVFVTAKGKVWAGPEQDFYVESEHGVFGTKKQRGAWMQWCDSLVARQGDEKCTMDKALDRFEKVDVFALNRAWCIGSQTTEISRTLFKPPFINYKTDDPLKLEFLRIQVGREELCLDMKSPNGRYTASATIDIKSKKVLKVVLEGKQIFPKLKQKVSNKKKETDK